MILFSIKKTSHLKFLFFRLLRSAVLAAAVNFGDEYTLTQAKQKFNIWRLNNTKVSVNLREVGIIF